MKTAVKVLTIAGSDSGGGAGIQGDLKTFSSHGCFGMSVITALTAQSVHGVRSVFPVPADFVKDQLECVLSEMRPAAVKIGMVLNRSNVKVIAASLEKYAIRNVVLDPVMISKSGGLLLEDDAIEALKAELFPLSLVITPNLPEGAKILKVSEPENSVEMAQMARSIQAIGNNRLVVLKGGHTNSLSTSDDFVFDSNGRNTWLTQSRHQTRNTHGTGCAFSSSIAAGLAKGLEPRDAILRAKEFISQAIEGGMNYDWNGGHGPIQHFISVE